MIDCRCLLKTREDSLNFVCVLRLYLAPVSLFEEKFETFMAKTLNHMSSVTSRLSHWNAKCVSAETVALIDSRPRTLIP